MSDQTTELTATEIGYGCPVVLPAEDKARELVTVADGELSVLVLNEGQQVERFQLGSFAETPKRKTGRVALTEADSFIGYVNRHLDPEATTLWSRLSDSAATVESVLDDHEIGEGNPRWGQHRASLSLQPTIEWAHWTKFDGKLISQHDFAEHLEDGAESVVTPSPAEMIEVASSIHASYGTSVKSTQRLTGEVQFSYDQSQRATAGNGKLSIPETFDLGLRPFDGSPQYKLTARFRYRVSDGVLLLGYRLIRAAQVRKAAFDDVVAAVSEGVSLPVLSGTPRS